VFARGVYGVRVLRLRACLGSEADIRWSAPSQVACDRPMKASVTRCRRATPLAPATRPDARRRPAVPCVPGWPGRPGRPASGCRGPRSRHLQSCRTPLARQFPGPAVHGAARRIAAWACAGAGQDDPVVGHARGVGRHRVLTGCRGGGGGGTPPRPQLPVPRRWPDRRPSPARRMRASTVATSYSGGATQGNAAAGVPKAGAAASTPHRRCLAVSSESTG